MAWWSGLAVALGQPAAPETNSIEIRSVTVEDKVVPSPAGETLRLGPFPKNIAFRFGPTTNSNRAPIRLRYKLEGYDDAWHEGGGEMFFTVRFYNETGDQIDQKIFSNVGDSVGWQRGLMNSSLTHRRETLVVPPQASRVLIVISSAGPPAAVGIFVVNDLVVSRLSATNAPEVLLQSPFDRQQTDGASDQVPAGWMRDGTRPSMARIVELGQNPKAKAFAILDNDPIGHAEWHNLMESSPKVSPGDHIEVQWNEMFSMGVGDITVARYDNLPPGNFRLNVVEVDPMEVPTGVEASLLIQVPPPFWRRSWFWGAVLMVITGVMVGGSRYFIRQRVRREMTHLKNQQVLERERLRIAHDIHDDLGARVTQISLLSAVAYKNAAFPEKARAEFDQISKMSRDLISALYQTVWAVNPENDNLNALGDYLCQMVNQLCDRADCGCRFYLQELPREIQVSSQTRHNISMGVKEAVHNVIKHAKASEVTIRMTFKTGLLTVGVQDNGCGFQMGEPLAGNGLTNMKARLKELGGDCLIESQPGKGTTVEMRLVIKPLV
ncbi:MAG: Integral rane sensor signal transduction histidine kinase [Pedosphaera sp.]|nr:Integral rane sensor signal transduction histidine kinase [Pedosphaera sp.]